MPTVPELMPEKPKVSILAEQISQIKQRQQTDFVGTMQAVSKVNPDQFAQATAIERWSGIPADVLNRHKEKADALLATRKYENLYTDYAKTARALADGKVAAIAHDDIESITRIEDAVAAAKFNQQGWAERNLFNPAEKWWDTRAQSSNASRAVGLQNQLGVFDEIDRASNAGEIPLGTVEQRQQAGPKGLIYLNASPEDRQQMRADLLKLQEDYSGRVAEREESIKSYLPDPGATRAQRLGGGAGATWQAMTENPGYLWRVTAESAPNMIEALAAGFVGGPAGAGAASFNLEKGHKRLDVLREAKVDLTDPRAFLRALQDDDLMTEAESRSSLKAAGIGAVDMLTAGIAGKLLMPAKVAGRTLSQTGREIGNLAIQAPVQGVGEAAGEATGQMLADGEVDGGEVLLEGLAGGLTSTLDVMTYGGDRVVASVSDGLRKTRNAKAGKAALDQMVEAVEGGKLKGRDLETFKSVTSQQLKDSDIETVWIPAAKLQELNQSGITILPELLKEIPGMGEQFAEAAARGGSVQMKTSDYLAHLGGFHDQLGDFVRVQADGMSVDDIKGWEDEQVAQLEMMAKAMKEEADPKSVVYQDAMGQLIAAGWQQQDAAQVAGLRTAMITKLAKRTGMSVEELMARDPLNIRNAAPEQVRKMPITDLGLMIDRLRTGDVPKPADMFGKSLLEQLTADGGVQDIGGELAALDADVGRVGRNRLARPEGKTPDDAAMWAWERGYFPGVAREEVTPDLLVNAIRDELAGRPRYSVSNENQTLRDQADALNQLQEYLDRSGLDLSQMDNAQIIEALSKPQGEQSYNQFAGVKAETADKYALDEAMKMLEAGRTAESVRQQTGWHVGEDGYFRFEIPDDEAAFKKAERAKPDDLLEQVRDQITYGERLGGALVEASFVYNGRKLMGSGTTRKEAEMSLASTLSRWVNMDKFNIESVQKDADYKLSDVLDHPKLFSAYPDMANIRVSFDGGGDYRGIYYESRDRIVLKLSSDFDQMLSTLLHEIQHAIQAREGFARGGDVNETFAENIKKALQTEQYTAMREIEHWQWLHRDDISAAEKAAEVSRYALMYESAQRLIDYSRRDSPSGVFRLIRNEMQWLYSDKFHGNRDADDLTRRFYDMPKRHNAQKRNAFIRDMAFDSGRFMLDAIPQELRDKFKSDPRTTKGMLKALEREAEKARAKLKPLRRLKDTALAAEKVATKHRFSGSFSIYEALAGEVEARNTQARLKMNAEQRKANSPRSTQDVDPQFVIVRFGGMDVRAPVVMASADQQTLNQSAANDVDAEYFAAIERGDMEAAQEMVNQAAKSAGYDGEINGRMEHSAPDRESGYKLTNLKESGIVPDDYWTKPEWYQGTPEEMDAFRNVSAALRRIESKSAAGRDPGKTGITVYRAVPKNVKDSEVRNGDWVSPSRSYAEQEGRMYSEGFRIISQNVLVDNLWWDANSVAEFGYDDGQTYAYQNTKNNRKLLDVVTRDDDGEVIPLSKRFNKRKDSVLFQPDGGVGSPDDNRGSITFGGRKDGVREFTINLGQKADLSTVLHEFGHYYLEVIGDLVGDGKANAELAADYAEIRKWLGAEEGAKLTVDQHEQFARGFEKYLAEGKAPSIELQAAFARFKRWMVGIYKDLTKLHVELTDEVRGVFDRLLASDEEIEAAIQVSQAVPMFESAEKAGMTEAEWASYQNKLLLARDDAESDIARQIQAEEERRQSKWWNEQLGRIRKEVTEEVDLVPVYKAMKALRTGQLEGVAATVKLQSGEVNERYGKRVLQRLAFMHAKQGGVPMDIAASMLGFKSGDEMVKAILGAPSRASAIEQEAQQRMLERHGNKVTGEAADKAMAAVHNERRADVLRMELEALAKQGNRRRVTSQSILKEAASRIMQQRKVRDIAPHEYQRAEAKAGREAFAAAAKGDLDAAYEAKQRQLLNFHLYREAVKAREQVTKITERMKGYNKPSRRQKIGKAGHDYLDQIDAVMEQYEFRNVSLRELDKRVSFGQWYNDQVAAGNDPYVPEFILGSMGKTNYKDLSLDQLQELDEFTRHVEHLARFKNKLLANDRIASKEEAANMLVDGAYANMEQLGRELIDKNARDVSEETRDYLREGNSSLMKVEQVISWLDDNKTDGNWTQVFWRPLAEAQHKRDDMNREVTQKVNAAIRAWFDTLGKDAGQKIHIKGTNQPITRNGVLAVALNQGNAGNKAKLLKGYGWDQSVVDEILSHMTKDDWQLVNDLWDIVGSLWPEIAALEKQANGIAPAAVEHTPVETPYGVLSGGYWPLVYDTMSDAYANVLKDMGTLAPLSEQGQARASTPRGHTKARVDSFAAPIVLDVSIIGHHLAAVIHDLTHRLPLADARSLLTTPSVVSALNKTIGKPMTAQFRNMVDGIASDLAPGSQKGIGVIQRGMNVLRSNQAVAWMGYSVTTMINQIGGYAQGMEYFAQRGARKHYLKALAKFAANPISQMEMARAMSGEMRNRDINLDQTLREATNQMIRVKDGKMLMDAWKSVKSGRDALVRYSFVPLMYVQRMVDVPVFMAAYELEGGALNHDIAVQAAERAVRLTQMAGGAKDLSSVQHSDLLRFFLPVYGYASLLWNRNVDVARAAGQGIKQRSAKQVLVAFERFIYLNILPAMLAAAIRGDLPDEDDEETWAAWVAVNSLLSVTNGVPLMRDVAAGAFSDFGYGGASQIGAGFGNLLKASNSSSAEAITTNMVSAAGQLIGLPSSQINRAVRTGFALEDGEMEDSADAILRGILFGPPRK